MADAVTLVGDMKPRQELVRTGMVEATMQFIDAFNDGSAGSIRLIEEDLEGDFNRENFFQLPSDLISRRDPTADTDIDTKKVTEDQNIGVKLNRRIGPLDMTMDSFKKIGVVAQNQRDTASLIFGREIARRTIEDKLNSSILGLRAALDGEAAVKHTASGALTTSDLIDGVAKFGDAGGEIVAWVMHSFAYYQLVKDQGVTKSIDGLSSVVLAGGSPATFGKPVIVTDSAALATSTGGGSVPVVTTYHSLGLTRDALVCRNSEPMTVINEWTGGNDNIKLLWQGEYAFNVSCKGFQFATGTPNPDDAALGNSSNWTFVYDTLKNGAGVVIESTS